MNPDEFYVYKPNVAAGRPAILRKSVGEQGDQDGVRATTRAPAKSVATVDVPLERIAALFDHRRGGRGARALRADHRAALRPADGHRMGPRRRRRQALHPAGAPGDGEVAGVEREHLRRYRLDAPPKCWRAAAPSARRSGRAPCAWSQSAAEMDRVAAGDVLVTDMTDPDWEPVMKRAAAIVTNRGGRTCHAAIIARELGIPAVVGCGDATSVAARRTGGHRVVRRRRHRAHLRRAARDRDHRRRARQDAAGADQDHDERRQSRSSHSSSASCRTRASAWRGSSSSSTATSACIRKALIDFDAQPAELKAQIAERIGGYDSPTEFYVAKIAEGVATIARGLLAEEGHRAPFRLQVQRIFEPARRRALRAARRKSDARLSRRLALHRAGVLRLLRARVPRAEARARRHGPHQRRGHDPFRAHGGRGRAGDRRCSRRTASSAEATDCGSS